MHQCQPLYSPKYEELHVPVDTIHRHFLLPVDSGSETGRFSLLYAKDNLKQSKLRHIVRSGLNYFHLTNFTQTSLQNNGNLCNLKYLPWISGMSARSVGQLGVLDAMRVPLNGTFQSHDDLVA